MLTQTATVTVPAPGYYRVRVVAAAPTAGEFLPDGRGVQNYNVHEEWLLLCGNGGRATGEWGRASFEGTGGPLPPGRFEEMECLDPAASLPRARFMGASRGLVDASTGLVDTAATLAVACEPQDAGSERAMGGPSASAHTLTGGSIDGESGCDGGSEAAVTAPAAAPVQSSFLSGDVYYLNYTDSVAIRLPRARVYIKTLNGTWTSPVTMTNENGEFTVQCPPSWVTTAILEVWSEHSDVVVVDTDTARTKHHVPPAAVAAMAVNSASCATRAFVWVTSPKQAELFHNHLVAIKQSRDKFGTTVATLPAQLRAVIKRPYNVALTGVYGTEKPPGTMVDSIVIREEVATGPWGQFVAAHEYAHAAHHSKLGGMTGFRRTNNCFGHALQALTSMGCAAVEGFANFWAAVARWPTPPSGPGGRIDRVYDDIGRNTFLYNFGGSARDGSKIEGAVAAFLFDLIDPIGPDTLAGVPGEPHPGLVFEDSLQLSPSIVAGVVRDCKIFTYFSPYPASLSNHSELRADGIDHWAYCLEQEMRRVQVYSYTIYECGGKAPLYCPLYQSWVAWDNRFHPDIADTYFQDRRTEPSSLGWLTPQYPVAWKMGTRGPDPATPPRPDVRRLWLCNLYGQRCTTRSLAPPFP